MNKPWDGIISQKEQEAYRAAGFGGRSGLGVRPGLLIIDVQYRTTGTVPRPFWEAIKEFPTSCGEVAWNAVHNIERLLVPLSRARLAGALSLCCAQGEVRSRPAGREDAEHHDHSGEGLSVSAPRSRRARAMCCCPRNTRARSSARRSPAISSISAWIRWSLPAAPPAVACAARLSTPLPITSGSWCRGTRSTTAAKCPTPSIFSTCRRSTPR